MGFFKREDVSQSSLNEESEMTDDWETSSSFKKTSLIIL
jgi:hypothetical protein